jgi:hypothetical protein
LSSEIETFQVEEVVPETPPPTPPDFEASAVETEAGDPSQAQIQDTDTTPVEIEVVEAASGGTDDSPATPTQTEAAAVRAEGADGQNEATPPDVEMYPSANEVVVVEDEVAPVEPEDFPAEPAVSPVEPEEPDVPPELESQTESDHDGPISETEPEIVFDDPPLGAFAVARFAGAFPLAEHLTKQAPVKYPASDDEN